MNEQASVGPVVDAVNISKRFGSTTALHDVTMTVRAGSTHALVGRNGAGKSTLVNILTGLHPPDACPTGTPGAARSPASTRRRPSFPP
jgi:simple sugar transport system ATP-binding protein